MYVYIHTYCIYIYTCVYLVYVYTYIYMYYLSFAHAHVLLHQGSFGFSGTSRTRAWAEDWGLRQDDGRATGLDLGSQATPKGPEEVSSLFNGKGGTPTSSSQTGPGARCVTLLQSVAAICPVVAER